MERESIKWRFLHPEVVEITLSRPDKRNALTLSMMEELLDLLDEVKERRVLLRRLQNFLKRFISPQLLRLQQRAVTLLQVDVELQQ